MKPAIPEETLAHFHRRLKMLYAAHFRPILLGEWHLDQMTADSLDERRACDQLTLFERITGQPLNGLDVLEIGSGVGITLVTARYVFNANAYGIEPGTNEFEGIFALGRDIIAAYGLDPHILTLGLGEALPFPDSSFHAVISSNVLEHVQSPARVLSEAIRILKPGGYLQFVVPNYGSWWEGHYGVLWIPHAPAWLAKLYLRLIRKDPSYVDSLQLVTHGKMQAWLKPHQDKVDILDWGVDLWEERVRSLNFTTYSTLRRVKNILRFLHTLYVIDALVTIGRVLHWETPLVLTLRKH